MARVGASELGTNGIVLAGGGMHAAYEVGVVAGIMEALAQGPSDTAPFRIFAGTSAGAFNAAYLASRAHRGDHDIGGLMEAWRSFDFRRFLKITPWSPLPKLPHWLTRREVPDEMGSSGPGGLLDPSEIEAAVTAAVDWEQLHKNAESGQIDGLSLHALHVLSGRMTQFLEMRPGLKYTASGSHHRRIETGPCEPIHVFASGAIPGVFPATRVNGRFYCDGGVCVNTPTSPPIRMGADRIVVVTQLDGHAGAREPDDGKPVHETLGAGSFLGKVLGALTADTIDHDLELLERYNRLAEVLEKTLSSEQLAKVHAEVVASRGMPIRKVPTLVFRPHASLAELGAHAVRKYNTSQLNAAQRALLHWMGPSDDSDGEWPSFLFFDGSFAAEIMQLAREETLARTEDIREFFLGKMDRNSVLY